ncbi:ribonuclease P protein subunit p25-like protein [Notamacropus eugenii]|uniref:ribonuclease P protein subunit p25-like protein n=1 Tax=Notamacropus eugenii TaxID=9315 RepID=UPI003B66E9AF
MENYQKVSSVEKPLVPPVPGLPPDILEMRVRDGSKIRNLLGFVLGRLESESTQLTVFTGASCAIGKAVTCAEIMKRCLPGLHQLTKLHFQQTEDAWVPVVPEAGLDPLTVCGHAPAVWLLHSKDPLDLNEGGYQPPGAPPGLGQLLPRTPPHTPQPKKWGPQASGHWEGGGSGA